MLLETALVVDHNWVGDKNPAAVPHAKAYDDMKRMGVEAHALPPDHIFPEKATSSNGVRPACYASISQLS
jgi:hypothetical protein